jgi:catechol 2,3-dioxygenase-like lactoylglutathione lyase family enzyme
MNDRFEAIGEVRYVPASATDRRPKARRREVGMVEELLAGAATVLVVTDVAKSTAYYRDALGFTVTFQDGEPISYACLCRDEVPLHLLAAQKTRRQPGNGGICVFVKDVDGLHAELLFRGANMINAPQDRDYGTRDFDVVDLDGNQLTFGKGSASAS